MGHFMGQKPHKGFASIFIPGSDVLLDLILRTALSYQQQENPNLRSAIEPPRAE